MMQFKKQKMIPLIFKLIMVILAWLPAKAQVLEYYPIDDKLQEISGLELLNDSTLIAFNDGGNKSEIYLLNLKGEILRTVDVEDTKNRDWEDIAIDKEYVYIGDIGNNENKRDNLSIVKLKISDILTRDQVEAETISFRYQEQTASPKKLEEMYYDAEGMTICGDSIWIFTKDRSNPFKGISLVYKIPKVPGDYTVSSSHKIEIGMDGWWKDGITAADFHEGLFYLLTYNRYIVMKYQSGGLQLVSEYLFDGITQRESIVVLNNQAIFVADEENPIVGKVLMYKIQPY